MRILEEQSKLVQSDPEQAAFALVKKDFDNRLKAFQKRSDTLSEQVRHMFAFCDTVFPDGQEQLILVTELTANPYSARFLGEHKVDAYFVHDKELMFHQRQLELNQEIANLEL